VSNSVRISLANKCQLLFGAAVLLIITAALSVGWVRMQTLVREGQQEAAQKLAEVWLTGFVEADNAAFVPPQRPTQPGQRDEQATFHAVPKADFDPAAADDPFFAAALDYFASRPDRRHFFRMVNDDDGKTICLYARAVRESDLLRLRQAQAPTPPPAPKLEPASIPNPLEFVLLISLHSDLAHRQLMLNRVYIVAAGLLAGLLAIGTFWFITTRIILSPVRVLRDTAAKISEGDLAIRSDINTGDEFEQLSDMFNTMLENLKRNQDQLRSINKSLDLKLGELAEANVTLYEANKIKGEFLANVSHELRTPLNSIIGFAEVLEESIKTAPEPANEKQLRYVSNIIASSRQLLDLINDLLDLAKIEAGRMELRVGSLSVADTCEGLINLIRPQAEKRNIKLTLALEPNIPLVQTDAGKFQQILFNFLSNAVKFTPPEGSVTLSAKLLPATKAGQTREGAEPPPEVRVSVADTGPGISADQHERIFEKFTQLDSTVTREHSGTGLGLTISRELAHLLQGRIELESDLGKGATFSLIIPLSLEPKTVPLMPDLAETPSTSTS
jgi:signal transduction histidine kinase